MEFQGYEYILYGIVVGVVVLYIYLLKFKNCIIKFEFYYKYQNVVYSDFLRFILDQILFFYKYKILEFFIILVICF